MNKLVFFCISVFIGFFVSAEIIKAELPLFLYSDYGDVGKHNFYPVGKMGSKNDVSLVENNKEAPFEGKSCIRVKYFPKSKSSWAGVYWLHPPNNWGILPDEGYDLSEAKRFVFYGKGEKGGEKVAFKLGGLRGKNGDTCTIMLNDVILNKEWTRYEVDLSEHTLTRIIGGFSFSLKSDQNPSGAVFYLDELRYE